jgi:nucleoside-triphosphate--adenylate kinase
VEPELCHHSPQLFGRSETCETYRLRADFHLNLILNTITHKHIMMMPLRQTLRSSATMAVGRITGTSVTTTAAAATSANRTAAVVGTARRSFMSTQAQSAPEEQTNMVLILGAPGGGKGTISNKVLHDFPKFHHVSTGDLLRQHVRERTPLGQQAAAYMEQGQLVPDQLMIDVLLQDATTHLEEGKSLLLDGFPRNIPQAQALEDVAHIDYVINLDIPTETIVARIADRWIHPASGRVYSYSYRPPKVEGVDDETGEPLVQRDDDKPEAVRTRLAAYDKVCY